METYGTGLLLYHVACDARGIPKRDRAPASRNSIAVFVAELVGRYSEAAVKNAVSGLRAWHTIHRHEWRANDAEIDALIRAAAREAPARRPQRPALDLATLILIAGRLNPTIPRDAAVRAALWAGFWGTARVGEMCPRTLTGPTGFSPQRCVTVNNLHHTQDQAGNPISVLHIPETKMSPITGEDLYWGPRSDSSDASSAIRDHLSINSPPPNAHLFAYRDAKGRPKTLTRTVFLARLKTAAASAGVVFPPGHSIRVSSTTHYLLNGLSFDAMRVKGRWAGNSYTLYLRRHAEIMAPYLQENPAVHSDILRRTAVLPPVARS